jgi:hypothetical protein
MIAFTSEDNKRVKQREDSGSPSMTMSMFRPPLPANVRCQTGRPIHISFAEVSSEIVCASGPWRMSGNWWKSEEWRREEWDIAAQLVNGVGLFRIFRDLRQDAWFVEGLYD